MDSDDEGDRAGLGLGDRPDRLEEIAETLEDGEVGLETARELREEGDEHLVAVREELDVGDGEIIEMEAEDVDLDDLESAES